MRGQQIARWATHPDKKGEEVTEQAAGLSEELMIHLNLSEIKARGLWCGRVGVREQRGRPGAILWQSAEQAVTGKAKQAALSPGR